MQQMEPLVGYAPCSTGPEGIFPQPQHQSLHYLNHRLKLTSSGTLAIRENKFLHICRCNVLFSITGLTACIPDRHTHHCPHEARPRPCCGASLFPPSSPHPCFSPPPSSLHCLLKSSVTLSPSHLNSCQRPALKVPPSTPS